MNNTAVSVIVIVIANITIATVGLFYATCMTMILHIDENAEILKILKNVQRRVIRYK